MLMNIYACAHETASVSECCVCDLSVAAHILRHSIGSCILEERGGQKDGGGHILTPSALV